MSVTPFSVADIRSIDEVDNAVALMRGFEGLFSLAAMSDNLPSNSTMCDIDCLLSHLVEHLETTVKAITSRPLATRKEA